MWHQPAQRGGGGPIGELVEEVGWSRRHLAQRFRAELGLTPRALRASVVGDERPPDEEITFVQDPDPPGAYGERMQNVYPVLRYRDAPAAIGFLTTAFGFTEHFVVEGPSGTIAHAQLRFGASLVMLGSVGGPDRPAQPPGSTWNYLVVADADAHHDAAVAGGAEIVRALEDQDYGSREYTARDPEGNLWSFGTYQPDPVEPGATPFLAYEDGLEAMVWLADAFGFQELVRIVDGGRLSHGTMETGSGVVMLASPTPDYEGPRRHRQHCDVARRWSAVPWVVDGVLVYVPDVDAHHRRARSAGASVLTAPEDGTEGRRYRAEDLEGHRWMFLQR